MASNVSFGATSPIPPAEPITAAGSATAGNTETLYTVPTGQTLYVTGGIVMPGAGACNIAISGTNVFVIPAGAGTQYLTGNPVLALTAGQTLQIQAASTTVVANFWGYLL